MRKPDDPIVSTDSESAQSFYGRWSRRKNQARRAPLPVDQPDAAGPGGNAGPPSLEPAPAAPPAVVEPGEADAGAAERVLTDADMPPLESLGEDDDYSGFLSPGVSETLRNQALRKLFMSSKFNVVDGLNDYDEDFRSFEPLGDIVTADMRHRIEVEAQRAREKAEEELRAVVDESGAGEERAGGEDGQDAQALQADPPQQRIAAGAQDPVPGQSPTPGQATRESAGDGAHERADEPRDRDV